MLVSTRSIEADQHRFGFRSVMRMTSSNAYILARTCQRLRCALRCYGRCPYDVFTIKKGSKNCQMLKNARSARIVNLSVCIDARPAKRAAPSRRATQLPGLLCFCLRRCRCVPYRIRWKCGDNVATGALRSPRSLTHGGAAPQPAAACAPGGARAARTPYALVFFFLYFSQLLIHK